MSTHTKTRGAANRVNCKVVTITLPRSWENLISEAVALEDSDRSKLCRAAIREYLTKRGHAVPQLTN